MNDKKMRREQFESIKKLTRQIDSQIIDMQMKLNDLHEISYQIQEMLMNIEDNARETYFNSWKRCKEKIA